MEAFCLTTSSLGTASSNSKARMSVKINAFILGVSAQWSLASRTY